MKNLDIQTIKDVIFATEIHSKVLSSCIYSGCPNYDELRDVEIGLQISIDKLKEILENTDN